MKSAFRDDKQEFLNLKKVRSEEATDSTQKKMERVIVLILQFTGNIKCDM